MKRVEKEISLEAENLTTDSLRGVSFKVRKGELVGIGGLRGQGQRHLLSFLVRRYSLFGNRKAIRQRDSTSSIHVMR